MTRSRTRTIAIGAVAALAVAGGGAALAATQLGDPKAESQKIVTDAANELGVTPSALQSAIEKAMKARIDAAVDAGRMTKEQGDALKKRIDAGELPLFAGPGMGYQGRDGFGHHGHMMVTLDEAAAYLGMTEDALHNELESGKSLADVAKAKDKSVDGLVAALVTAQEKKIDAAVADGRITKEQADSLKADLKSRVTDAVNGVRKQGMPPHGMGPGMGHPWGDGDGPAVMPASQGSARI